MISDRDRELARQALRILLASDGDDQVENLAAIFALARHEGAREAIREMRAALLETPREPLADVGPLIKGTVQ